MKRQYRIISTIFISSCCILLLSGCFSKTYYSSNYEKDVMVVSGMSSEQQDDSENVNDFVMDDEFSDEYSDSFESNKSANEENIDSDAEDEFVPMYVQTTFDGTINDFLYDDYICYADEETPYDRYANIIDYSENGSSYSIMISYYQEGCNHADEYLCDLEQTDNGYTFVTSSGRKMNLTLVSIHSFALTSTDKNSDEIDWCGYYFYGDRYAAEGYDYEAMNYSGGYEGPYSVFGLSAFTDTDCSAVASVSFTEDNDATQNYTMYIANTDNAWYGQYNDIFEIHMEDGLVEYLCFYYYDGTVCCDLCTEFYNMETLERTELYEESLGSGYILPESNTRYLDESELYNLSEQELTYARNEIYARHGRKFKDESLVEYFTSKSWYVPMYSADEFDESVFNDYEIKNRDLIVQYEKKIK